jgi:hypothetical protein
MGVVFAAGPSRFRARFTVIVAGTNTKLSIFYFRAESIATIAAVACVILGQPPFPEAGGLEASSDESTIAKEPPLTKWLTSAIPDARCDWPAAFMWFRSPH